VAISNVYLTHKNEIDAYLRFIDGYWQRFGYRRPRPPSPNGIRFPVDYKSWQVIGTSHREDNHTLRVIIGNEIATNAVQAGKTNPWPEGSILGKS
jgi:hypothetical protein